jgi:integrase/recombinase XerD
MNWEEGKKGFENYLKLEKSLSQNSVSAYVNDINKLIVFLDKNYSKVTPLKVKLEHLKSFIAWLNERDISPRTQARTISAQNRKKTS